MSTRSQMEAAVREIAERNLGKTMTKKLLASMASELSDALVELFPLSVPDVEVVWEGDQLVARIREKP